VRLRDSLLRQKADVSLVAIRRATGEALYNPSPESVLAVGDTLIPHGGPFDLGARDVGLASRIDRYLPKMDPTIAQGFRGALAFLEQKAPELAGKTAPFSRLSEDDRTAVCNAMLQAGGLPAGILLAMKYVAMSHFYTMEETWEFTGYDGPMLLEEKR
jgi:hypothetical protein